MLPVAIVGAGPVGLALALMLHRAGIDCEIVDARPAGAVGDDHRVLALSHGSRQILERLGAWGPVDATPITTIHVSQQGRLGRTLIRAEEAGVPALGHVAEAGRVGLALAHACAAAGVKLHHDMRVTGSETAHDHVVLHCASAQGEQTLRAQLAAWAEGALGAGPGVVRRDYGQRAIVASVRTRQPAAGVAYERFTTQGPVALLPQGDGYAAVWTVPETACTALSSLGDSEFLARLDAVFSGRIEFTAVGARTTFPLGLRYRETPIARRAVWLGNAAQTLHPVAGQGFNLALRDVSQLARLLQDGPADCGDAALLARHAAMRQLDRRATIGFTDGLVRLFGLRGDVAAQARGAGLLALDLLPGARRFLARRMIFGARGW